MKLFIASIYHPVDDTEHEAFNGTLSSLLNSIPRTAEFIGRRDVNANLGIRLKMHPQVIGPHGIYNRNKRGRILLGLFSANNLRVMNIL